MGQGKRENDGGEGVKRVETDKKRRTENETNVEKI